MPTRMLFADPRFRSPTTPPGETDRRPLTIGFESPGYGQHTLYFFNGRASSGVDGVIRRMFLFGTVDLSNPNDHFTRHGVSLKAGQEQPEEHGIPGFEILVSGHTVATFSREVVMACSQGHLEQSAVEAMAGSLALLARKKPDELGDAAVTLTQILTGLISFPVVGYVITPNIPLARTDRVEVRGLPKGLRLYLTGVCRSEELR